MAFSSCLRPPQDIKNEMDNNKSSNLFIGIGFMLFGGNFNFDAKQKQTLKFLV